MGTSQSENKAAGNDAEEEDIQSQGGEVTSPLSLRLVSDDDSESQSPCRKRRFSLPLLPRGQPDSPDEELTDAPSVSSDPGGRTKRSRRNEAVSLSADESPPLPILRTKAKEGRRRRRHQRRLRRNQANLERRLAAETAKFAAAVEDNPLSSRQTRGRRSPTVKEASNAPLVVSPGAHSLPETTISYATSTETVSTMHPSPPWRSPLQKASTDDQSLTQATTMSDNYYDGSSVSIRVVSPDHPQQAPPKELVVDSSSATTAVITPGSRVSAAQAYWNRRNPNAPSSSTTTTSSKTSNSSKPVKRVQRQAPAGNNWSNVYTHFRDWEGPSKDEEDETQSNSKNPKSPKTTKTGTSDERTIADLSIMPVSSVELVDPEEVYVKLASFDEITATPQSSFVEEFDGSTEATEDCSTSAYDYFAFEAESDEEFWCRLDTALLSEYEGMPTLELVQFASLKIRRYRAVLLIQRWWLKRKGYYRRLFGPKKSLKVPAPKNQEGWWFHSGFRRRLFNLPPSPSTRTHESTYNPTTASIVIQRSIDRPDYRRTSAVGGDGWVRSVEQTDEPISALSRQLESIQQKDTGFFPVDQNKDSELPRPLTKSGPDPVDAQVPAIKSQQMDRPAETPAASLQDISALPKTPALPALEVEEDPEELDDAIGAAMENLRRASLTYNAANLIDGWEEARGEPMDDAVPAPNQPPAAALSPTDSESKVDTRQVVEDQDEPTEWDEPMGDVALDVIADNLRKASQALEAESLVEALEDEFLHLGQISEIPAAPVSAPTLSTPADPAELDDAIDAAMENLRRASQTYDATNLIEPFEEPESEEEPEEYAQMDESRDSLIIDEVLENLRRAEEIFEAGNVAEPLEDTRREQTFTGRGCLPSVTHAHRHTFPSPADSAADNVLRFARRAGQGSVQENLSTELPELVPSASANTHAPVAQAEQTLKPSSPALTSIVLQSMSTVREAKLQEASATVIQTWWKTLSVEGAFKKQKASCTTIQSLVQRQSAVALASTIRRQAQLLEASAVVIQSWWRSASATDSFRRHRTSCIKIQSLSRRNSALCLTTPLKKAREEQQLLNVPGSNKEVEISANSAAQTIQQWWKEVVVSRRKPHGRKPSDFISGREAQILSGKQQTLQAIARTLRQQTKAIREMDCVLGLVQETLDGFTAAVLIQKWWSRVARKIRNREDGLINATNIKSKQSTTGKQPNEPRITAHRPELPLRDSEVIEVPDSWNTEAPQSSLVALEVPPQLQQQELTEASKPSNQQRRFGDDHAVACGLLQNSHREVQGRMIAAEATENLSQGPTAKSERWDAIVATLERHGTAMAQMDRQLITVQNRVNEYAAATLLQRWWSKTAVIRRSQVGDLSNDRRTVATVVAEVVLHDRHSKGKSVPPHQSSQQPLAARQVDGSDQQLSSLDDPSEEACQQLPTPDIPSELPSEARLVNDPAAIIVQRWWKRNIGEHRRLKRQPAMPDQPPAIMIEIAAANYIQRWWKEVSITRNKFSERQAASPAQQSTMQQMEHYNMSHFSADVESIQDSLQRSIHDSLDNIRSSWDRLGSDPRSSLDGQKEAFLSLVHELPNQQDQSIRLWKASVSHHEKMALAPAALKVQSCWRMYVAKKNYNRLQAASPLLPRMTRKLMLSKIQGPTLWGSKVRSYLKNNSYGRFS